MEGNYLVKKKGEKGYWTFGNVKKNQYGNYQLGLKVTPELRTLIEAAKDGDWINWSLFADDGPKKEATAAASGFADE